VTESLDTGQVRRTWNSGSYKVGGTLEEIWTTSAKSGLSHNGTYTRRKLPCERRSFHQ